MYTHETQVAISKKVTDEPTERMQLRVSKRFLAMVDEWRRKQPDIPNRTEAIRRMVAEVAGRK